MPPPFFSTFTNISPPSPKPLLLDPTHQYALRQLRQTGSVSNYQLEFETVQRRVLYMSARDHLDCFISGLQEDISRELRLLCPYCLSQAIDWAKKIEAKLVNEFQLRLERERWLTELFEQVGALLREVLNSESSYLDSVAASDSDADSDLDSDSTGDSAVGSNSDSVEVELSLHATKFQCFPSPPPLVSGTTSPPTVTTSSDSLHFQLSQNLGNPSPHTPTYGFAIDSNVLPMLPLTSIRNKPVVVPTFSLILAGCTTVIPILSDGEFSGYETRESTESTTIQSLFDAHRVFDAMTLSGNCYFSLTNGSLQFKHWDPGVNMATEKHSLVGNLQSFPKKDGNTVVGFIGVQSLWNFNGAIEPLRAEFDVTETTLQIYGQFSDCSISESSKFFIPGSLSVRHHMYVEMPHRTVVDAPIPDTEPHDPGPLKSPSSTVATYLPRYASKIISPVCGSVVTAQAMVEPIYYVCPKHYNPIFFKFVLDVAVRTLGLYTDYLVAPYTLPKLDIILIPAFVARNSWVFKHVVPFLLKGEVKLQILNALVKELETILDMSKPFTSPLPFLAATHQQIIHGVTHVCYEDDDGTTLIKAWYKVYGVQILDAAHANSYNPEQLPSEFITASKQCCQVGFIGLGAMGFGMATHLLRWKFCIFGYDMYALTQIRFAKNGGMIRNPPLLLYKGQSKIVSYMSSTLGSVLQILGLFSSLHAPMLKLYGSFSMSHIIAPMHTTCFAIAPSLSPAVSVSEMAHVPIAYAADALNAVGLFHGLINAKNDKLIGVEAAGLGQENAQHVVTETIGVTGACYFSCIQGSLHFKQWDPGDAFLLTGKMPLCWNLLIRASSMNCVVREIPLSAGNFSKYDAANWMLSMVDCVSHVGTNAISTGMLEIVVPLQDWKLGSDDFMLKTIYYVEFENARFGSNFIVIWRSKITVENVLTSIPHFDLEDKIIFEGVGNDTMQVGFNNMFKYHSTGYSGTLIS